MKEGCICFPLRSINNRNCMFPKFLRHQLVFLAKHHRWDRDLTTDPCAHIEKIALRAIYVRHYFWPLRRVQGENFP